MKIHAVISKSSRRALLVAVALLACGARPARAQDKSAPLSKVERLNRAPVNKEILRVKLPRPTIAKLPNGLTLILLEDHKLSTLAFTMWMRPGQLADPDDLPGLASFTADMLREGTARRTSAQIAAEVDSLGATLNADSRFGASYTTVAASRVQRWKHTCRFSDPDKLDIVLNPAFPDGELAKYKQRLGADLESQMANPNFLGQQAFRRVLYGTAPLSPRHLGNEGVGCQAEWQ